ncbi:MAG TPA: methyltransferase domain-containing protein [Polyangiaceae bacterium]
MFKQFDISILVPGIPFDGQTLETKSLGGSESAGLYMAKALSREGARVSLFCNTNATSFDGDGVCYQPTSQWGGFAGETPHDVCIVQRVPDAFGQQTNARLNLLWCHDLALVRQDHSFRGALWNVGRAIVLSRYMKDQYQHVYGLDDEAFFVSRNGVDLSLFHELREPGIERDRRKLMYCARPERGLDVLLRDVMPRLLAKDRGLRLFVGGYDNRPRDWEAFYAECDQLMAQLGDRVVRLGCLTKRELYRHYLSAGVYVYPTPSPALGSFREVSCISAMECQASGLPIVSTALGALSETIAPGAGVLIDKDPSDPAARLDYVEDFIDHTLRLVRDDGAWNTASAAGLAHAPRLDWSGIAKEWLAEFERLIRASNDSPERLVRHFWRTADIVAAKRVLGDDRTEAQIPEPGRAEVNKLLTPWSFMEEPEGYRKQYERIGIVGHDHHVYRTTPEELRFQLLSRWLAERRSEISTLLDYGCAHGAYAIWLAKQLEHLTIHGVDIDRFSVEMAVEWAEKLGVADRASFGVWTHEEPEAVPPPLRGAESLRHGDPSRWIHGGKFDCALVAEVLEHVPEPWAVLERVEQLVRPGGKVYFTVPYGPWELTSYRMYPNRCHIWHFDAHDLRDMMGSKPDLELNACSAGENPLTGQPQGWWIGSYTADHAPVPRVDLERHLWLQRPRQTVSAAIIAGATSHENLHWTLGSIQDVVDRIIIADCGMSEEARRIASQYDVSIVPGVDPTTYGFETARNLALDACTSDWCLWIDTDEKLVGAPRLSRYLRENVYHGYGLRQHHFACDTSIPADMPLRLFRRRPHDGRSLRFFGAIHEHPELDVNQGAGPVIVLRDVHVAHVGYLNENTRRERFARNRPLLELDQQRYPERLLQKHFLMRDNMHLVRYALEETGGQVNQEMRAKCRETVALYQKYFLGKGPKVSRESLPYYSEALEVLGEGFEAAFQIEADKTKAETNGVQRYRFASAEDFYTELKHRAAAKAARFDSQWW